LAVRFLTVVWAFCASVLHRYNNISALLLLRTTT